MRLIKINDNGTLSLTKDLHDDSIPQYAILSHTWGPDDQEVTYQDICNETAKQKIGYSKIDFCAQQARKGGLEFCWIDTCCIDKTNLIELSEALNSMFRWYREAKVCYVYLPDVTCLKRNGEGTSGALWEPAFRQSRWFSRGWTLQELLAPDTVQFFSREGRLLGSKETLSKIIQQITDIPIAALCGQPLSTWSVEERMRWRAKRVTKRKEDEVYSLLGIFGVHIIPIYGEGEHAWVRLKDEISKSFRSRLDNPASTSSAVHSYHSVNEQDLLASLKFEQMEARRSTIKKAYSSTCDWLLEHTTFRSWRDSGKFEAHGGVLWINGKPGCGKSTLMKHLHSSAEKSRLPNEIVLGYYFNARGDEMEKSTLGMYQSLLFQVTTQVQDLQDTLAAVIDRPGHPHVSGKWTIDLLQEVWLAIVERLPSRRLQLYIDALDECDEQEVREMIIFFEDLAEKGRSQDCQLYICFASRHYPTIDIRNGGKIVVEDEEGHDKDLVKYVHRHLRSGSGKQVESIREEICSKANGVFLWAVLVVDILNTEFRSGRIYAVRKRLKEIPPELSELFINIIQRDSTNMDELLLALQWVLFAKRPLKRNEFYYAMVSGLDPTEESMGEWDPDHITIEHLTTYVQNSSKGFAELTRGKEPTVQFIHESVRDFLLKDGGLAKLSCETDVPVLSLGHERLKQCCRNYLADRLTVGLNRYKASTEEAKSLRAHWRARLPFFEYAVQYILHHSNQAAHHVDQGDFLQELSLRAWIRISNMFEKFEVRRYGETARLGYILAEKDHAALLSRLIKQDVQVYAWGEERYHFYLFAAVANNSRAALRVLLQSDSYPEPDVDSIGEDLGSAAILVPKSEGKFWRYDSKSSSPLSWALDRNHQTLANMLLAGPSCTSPELLCAYRNEVEMERAVDIAALKGYESVVELLLRALQWTFVRNEAKMMSVLCSAARGGSVEVMQSLCPQESMVATHRLDLKRALHNAAGAGQKAAVQLLLDWHADVDSTDSGGSTPLVWAARNGHHEVVGLLLERGATINLIVKTYRGGPGDTALYWAITGGHLDTVNLLLARGADIWTISDSTCTAISHAASCGNVHILRAVLAYGVATDRGAAYVKSLLVQEPCWPYSAACIVVLIEHGAQLEARDGFGQTPLLHIMEAASRVYDETAYLAIVTKLLDLGADCAARDYHGNTPLLLAVKHLKVRLARLFVEHGADVSACDLEGRTIKSIAQECGSEWMNLLERDVLSHSPPRGPPQTPAAHARPSSE